MALTRSAAPVGNGQGPATVILSSTATPQDGGAFFGFASAPCANLAAADASVRRPREFVLGAGPYYAASASSTTSPTEAAVCPPE